MKILGVFIPLVLVAELTVFGFQTWSFYGEQKDELLDRLDNLVTVQSTGLASAVWEFDTDETQTLVSQIMDLPYVIGVTVRDESGEIFAAMGVTEEAPARPEFRQSAKILFSEQGNDQPVGTLEVTVTGDQINDALNDYLKFNGFVLLSLFVALVLSTLIATRLFIGRPLDLLKQAIEQDKADQSRPRVQWESADELGVVVKAYNSLQDAQEDADQQIKSYQAHLEELVEERTAKIRASIEYASVIQRSVLPHHTDFDAFFDRHFIIWKPRDVVGGDMYWLRPWGEGMLLALGDCTGHGVPGALMTMLATGALDRAQTEIRPGDVGKLTQRMHQILKDAQQVADGQGSDGMEIGICYFPNDRSKFQFCGARFSVFTSDGSRSEEIKGDRKGIGYGRLRMDQTYSAHSVPLDPARTYYLTTDGFIDQVGGEEKRCFGKRRFKETLSSVSQMEFGEQRKKLMQTFHAHRGSENQLDDLALIGFSF
ncbi:SpoIIE family protein phosphatase [Magnetospira sp. QH-2]|uniref:SpoIIE family protein phosphatase n=1 Tax=Magnetospira sp. (strain QH-2) TaxID=1288970 RepID=UPI0003E81745|nr:SpoIIE family protein phosphatase [Magnetospira sp. QH-2]CCQ75545.1 Putative serine phosphatase [Magnetospira sp. QH-2]